MLLIISNTCDEHVKRFSTLAKKKHLPHVILMSDTLGEHTYLTVDQVSGELKLTVDGRTYISDDISCVWFRKPYHWWHETSQEYKQLNAATKQILRYKKTQVQTLLKTYIEQLNAHGVPIVPNPLLQHSAYSKIAQLHLAKQIGFDVPETIISTRKTHLQPALKSPEDYIIKNLGSTPDLIGGVFGSVAPTVNLDSKSLKHYLESKTIEFPFILQKKIYPKIDIRITCAGDKMFATSMIPKKADDAMIDIRLYSHTQIEHKPMQPPKQIKDKICLFQKKMNLEYAAFDLAYAEDSDVCYFLEVNPYGQYLFVEEDAGVDITGAMVDMFLNKIDRDKH